MQLDRRTLLGNLALGTMALGTAGSCMQSGEPTNTGLKASHAIDEMVPEDRTSYLLKKIDGQLSQLNPVDEDDMPEELSWLLSLVPEHVVFLTNNLKSETRTEEDLEYVTSSNIYKKVERESDIVRLKELLLKSKDTEALQLINNLALAEIFKRNINSFDSNSEVYTACYKRAVAAAFLKALLKEPNSQPTETEQAANRRPDLFARLKLA
ncbi:MAG: hypothetical protein OXU45_04250 [Candidatus Melainabacteria bacterium]|nr:hypothetical protein [Candidatus Melainabacteria bacterium]